MLEDTVLRLPTRDLQIAYRSRDDRALDGRPPASPDHLIRLQDDRSRDMQPERLSGLQIHH